MKARMSGCSSSFLVSVKGKAEDGGRAFLKIFLRDGEYFLSLKRAFLLTGNKKAEDVLLSSRREILLPFPVQ